MRVEVHKFERIFKFNINSVTQLCGQNIPKKTFVFESLRRYFGGFRYAEEVNCWRDNVYFEGVNPGRKLYSIVSIRNRDDLLNYIRLSKQSLMLEYVRILMQDYEWQRNLDVIDNQLACMFLNLNEGISLLGQIEMSYSSADIWDMVQKSTLTGPFEEPIENMSSFELIGILLNLLERIIQREPRNMMILFENIDNLLSVSEYIEVFEKMDILNRKYGLTFITSTSLHGYVYINEETIEGISIFNDEDFVMPSFEYISEFIRQSYPRNKKFSKRELCCLVRNVVQYIGQKNDEVNTPSLVILKLINNSLQVPMRFGFSENLVEIAFLNSTKMV